MREQSKYYIWWIMGVLIIIISGVVAYLMTFASANPKPTTNNTPSSTQNGATSETPDTTKATAVTAAELTVITDNFVDDVTSLDASLKSVDSVDMTGDELSL